MGKIKDYGNKINEKTRNNKKKLMRLFLIYFVILNILFSVNAMAEKPYHHVYENGKFKNSETIKFA